MNSLEPAIKIENVWKVFGNNSVEALDASNASTELLPNTFQTFSILIAGSKEFI